MSDCNYMDLVILESQRTFIDVAYSGCGSACSYCYVKTSSNNQQLASYADLDCLIQYLALNNLISNHIISFCPNTEPFKSKESIDRILYMINRLIRYHCYVQISTKEYIPDSLFQKLDLLSRINPIYINISMPFLNTATIEPHAADVQRRIANIKRANDYLHIKCGLYIKPFTYSALINVSQYINIIQQNTPDYVCVGIFFDKDTILPCATLYHSDIALNAITKQAALLFDFANQIRSNLNIPVVFSSICAISQFDIQQCTLHLWEYQKGICQECALSKEDL